MDLRRRAIRRGRWRALRLALVLPVLLGAVAFGVYADVIHPPDDLLPVILTLVVCMLLLVGIAIEIYEAFSHESPAIVKATLRQKHGFSILKDMEGFPPELILLNVVSGREFDMCVSRAFRIEADGLTRDAADLLGEQTFTVTRRVFRAVAPGNDTCLLCTPAGRAVKILEDAIDRLLDQEGRAGK